MNKKSTNTLRLLPILLLTTKLFYKFESFIVKFANINT